MIKVMLVDDQALVRGALSTLLSLEKDIEIVAKAGDGTEVLDKAQAALPDVVLMDVDMPGKDGLAATAELLAAMPQVKVLIVTTFGRPGFLRRAVQSGAQGFVVKDTPATELAEAVRRVHSGLRVVDPALAADSLALGDCPFTPREAEVVQAAADGAPIAEVAKRVHLSEGTTRNYLSSAMAKTATETRTAAVQVAVNNGWIIG